MPVNQARRYCWRYDWVLDMDMKAFFDTIDHDLMMRAVEKHVPEKWIRLYSALARESSGVSWRRIARTQSWYSAGRCHQSATGQPFSALCLRCLDAALLSWYSFWTVRWWHCLSLPQQRGREALLKCLEQRLTECKLQLHPVKTRLVYCKDGKRRGEHTETRFDFLGFSFHAHTEHDRHGQLFSGFNPGVSGKVLKRMSSAIRSLNINRSTTWTLPMLAARLNPMVRGWVTYYGAFYPETLNRFLVRIDLRLGRWARNKYKRLRGHKRQAWAWLIDPALRSFKLHIWLADPERSFVPVPDGFPACSYVGW